MGWLGLAGRGYGKALSASDALRGEHEIPHGDLLQTARTVFEV